MGNDERGDEEADIEIIVIADPDPGPGVLGSEGYLRLQTKFYAGKTADAMESGGFWMVIVGGVVMTGGAFSVPWTGPGGIAAVTGGIAIAFNGGRNYLLAAMLRAIEMDPPQKSFKRPVKLHMSSLALPKRIEGAPAYAGLRLIDRAHDDLPALTQGILDALERGQGAEQGGDAHWAAIHQHGGDLLAAAAITRLDQLGRGLVTLGKLEGLDQRLTPRFVGRMVKTTRGQWPAIARRLARLGIDQATRRRIRATLDAPPKAPEGSPTLGKQLVKEGRELRNLARRWRDSWK